MNAVQTSVPLCNRKGYNSPPFDSQLHELSHAKEEPV
jgi:hypothetical protein